MLRAKPGIIFFAMFYEGDTATLKRRISANRILFGSEFPHPEELATFLDYVKEFPSFNDDELKHVFYSNLKGLLEGVRDEAT
jgi:predicted TIM-barrel fold metal-dependent hydrolase